MVNGSSLLRASVAPPRKYVSAVICRLKVIDDVVERLRHCSSVCDSVAPYAEG